MHDDALRVIEARLQFCTHALRWICPLSSHIMCRTFSHFGWALGNGYIFVSNFQGSDSIYYSHSFSSLRSTRLCKGFDYRMKQKSILLRVIHLHLVGLNRIIYSLKPKMFTMFTFDFFGET